MTRHYAYNPLAGGVVPRRLLDMIEDVSACPKGTKRNVALASLRMVQRHYLQGIIRDVQPDAIKDGQLLAIGGYGLRRLRTFRALCDSIAPRDRAVTVYLAARWEQAPMMRTWRAGLATVGIGCTSRWLDRHSKDPAREAPHAVMTAAALEDYADVATADLLVTYSPRSGHGTGHGGRHSELGIALALQKPVVLVGDVEQVFHYHPLVTIVPETIDWRAVADGIKALP